MFFSSAPCFLAKRFQLHALSLRKKGGVVTAPKGTPQTPVFYGAAPQWSLWSRVCGAVTNTPLFYLCEYILKAMCFAVNRQAT